MIHFSNHAIDRYRERVKPDMRRNHVKRELKHLASMATMADAAPKWLDKGDTPVSGEDSHGTRYLEVTDGICFTLTRVHDGWLATTCLIRGGHVAKYRKPKRRKVNDWATSGERRRERNRIRRAA